MGLKGANAATIVLGMVGRAEGSAPSVAWLHPHAAIGSGADVVGFSAAAAILNAAGLLAYPFQMLPRANRRGALA